MGETAEHKDQLSKAYSQPGTVGRITASKCTFNEGFMLNSAFTKGETRTLKPGSNILDIAATVNRKSLYEIGKSFQTTIITRGA